MKEESEFWHPKGLIIKQKEEFKCQSLKGLKQVVLECSGKLMKTKIQELQFS